MSVHDGWDAPKPGWVCFECGFDYDAEDLATTPGRVKELAARHRAKLIDEAATETEAWRQRPDPATWTALEYACHTRDCFGVYDWRIRKVLQEDRVALRAMHRDEAVTEFAYNQQDPLVVADEVERNAASLSALLSSIEGDQWERIGIREGEELSVAWMARNVVHEAHHHLLDIDRVLSRAAGEQPIQ
jgi:hypothetical protein